jgi:hypothetical protein
MEQVPAESKVFSPSHFIGHWYLAEAVVLAVSLPPQEASNVSTIAQETNILFMV